MRVLILGFGLLLLNTPGFSQDSLGRTSFSNILPRHSIKFSPLHLMNFYPTVQLAYEVKIAPIWTLQLDGGVVVDYGVDHQDYSNKRGFKVKLEPHYYFSLVNERRLGFYVALELYLNHVNFDMSSTQNECFDPECQDRYQRTYRYTMKYEEHGFALKMGMIKYFGRFLFDVNTGWGLRFINYTAPSYIRDFEGLNEDEWIEIPRIEDRVELTPIINARVGYTFR